MSFSEELIQQTIKQYPEYASRVMSLHREGPQFDKEHLTPEKEAFLESFLDGTFMQYTMQEVSDFIEDFANLGTMLLNSSFMKHATGILKYVTNLDADEETKEMLMNSDFFISVFYYLATDDEREAYERSRRFQKISEDETFKKTLEYFISINKEQFEDMAESLSDLLMNMIEECS